MANIIDLGEHRSKLQGNKFQSGHGAINTGDGGGGDMEDVLRRLGKLEDYVSDLRQQLGQILVAMQGVVRHEDLAKMETKIIKWNVGTIIAVAALAFAGAKIF